MRAERRVGAGHGMRLPVPGNAYAGMASAIASATRTARSLSRGRMRRTPPRRHRGRRQGRTIPRARALRRKAGVRISACRVAGRSRYRPEAGVSIGGVGHPLCRSRSRPARWPLSGTTSLKQPPSDGDLSARRGSARGALDCFLLGQERARRSSRDAGRAAAASPPPVIDTNSGSPLTGPTPWDRPETRGPTARRRKA